MDTWTRRLPGLLITLASAGLAFALWWATKSRVSISPLLWAFVLSILATNLIPVRERYQPGIGFASSVLLKIAVASLGILVSAAVWWRLGGLGLAATLINLLFAAIVGLVVCKYLLKLGDGLSVLIAVGTSICGASAIAATAPAIGAEDEEIGVSLAVVTLFGLVAMFLYPYLFSFTGLGAWLHHDIGAFGLWSGIGIHETAQVIACSSQIDGALEMAMLAKSIRIFMIGPMVILAVLYLRRQGRSLDRQRISIPWFALVFILFTLVHAGLEALFGEAWTTFSTDVLKPPITFLLTWAFAAVGFKVKFRQLVSIGAKAFVGGLFMAALSGGTALLLTKYLWCALSR